MGHVDRFFVLRPVFVFLLVFLIFFSFPSFFRFSEGVITIVYFFLLFFEGRRPSLI